MFRLARLQADWQSCMTSLTHHQSCATSRTHWQSCAMCLQCQRCCNITKDIREQNNQYQNINQNVFIPIAVKFHHWHTYNIVILLTLQTHWWPCATSRTHWRSCLMLPTHQQFSNLIPATATSSLRAPWELLELPEQEDVQWQWRWLMVKILVRPNLDDHDDEDK